MRRRCRRAWISIGSRFPTRSAALPPQDRRTFYAAVLRELLDDRVGSSRSRCVPRGLTRKMSRYPLRSRVWGRTRWRPMAFRMRTPK